jgi:ribosomal protein S18 acetylase RimI-like enzyme
LLESLDFGDDFEISQHWREEIRRRCEEIDPEIHALLKRAAEIQGRTLSDFVVSAVRLGRLVVDQTFKTRGLGGALLIDAARRVRHSDIAAVAMVVDAKDDRAAAFYRHHGLLDLSTDERALFVALMRLTQRLGIIQ